MERKFGKLVRDNIPKIIQAEGNVPECSVLDERGYVEALKQKLIEEVGEFLEGLEIEELADVMEVIGALKLVLGYEDERVEEMRIRKREVNGGFEERLFLESVRYKS